MLKGLNLSNREAIECKGVYRGSAGRVGSQSIGVQKIDAEGGRWQHCRWHQEGTTQGLQKGLQCCGRGSRGVAVIAEGSQWLQRSGRGAAEGVQMV